jgi:hypothetical protein
VSAHTGAIIQDCLTANNVQVLCHQPYLLDLVPVDFVLACEDDLVGVSLDRLNRVELVTRRITAKEFATAF